MEFCDLLNEWNNMATETVMSYLEKHRFGYLKSRVVYEYSADFGVIRPLRDVWIKLLDANPLEFVEFYEGIYRFRKSPHYENILLTVLISIASGFAANELHEKYKAWQRKNKDNEELHERFSRSAEILFEYLVRVYAVKEAYFNMEVSYEEFGEIRDFLKREIFRGVTRRKDATVEENLKFKNIWSRFVQNHLLSPLDLSIDELRKMVRAERENSSIDHQYQTKKILQPAEVAKIYGSMNGILVKGMPSSPGVACGVIKTIYSEKDSNKILDGCVAVLDNFLPITNIKRCIAIIGVGFGLTSHMAITVRAFDIPCVICQYEERYKFVDGQIVYLDGYNGVIQILSSTDEIKECINRENALVMKSKR